jgi:hypothetical protein
LAGGGQSHTYRKEVPVPASKKLFGIGLLATAALTLAACGGGDTKTNNSANTNPQTSAPGANPADPNNPGLSVPADPNAPQNGQAGAPAGNLGTGDGAPAQGGVQFNPDDFKATPVEPIHATPGGEPLRATPAEPIHATPAEPIHATPAEPIHPVPVDPNTINVNGGR